MKITEYLNLSKRESAQAVQNLADHMASWKIVEEEYGRLDETCIVLARRVLELREARSPQLSEAEAALKVARWNRDGTKAAFQRRRDDLHRIIEGFVREPIHKAGLDWLDLVKGLSKLYRYQLVESAYDEAGRHRRKIVKISHNADALDAARIRIFAGIKEIREMQYSSLSSVEKRIKELTAEFANIETDTMVIEAVTERQAADMKPVDDAAADMASMTVIPGVGRWVHPVVADSKVQNLSDRISALEKGA